MIKITYHFNLILTFNSLMPSLQFTHILFLSLVDNNESYKKIFTLPMIRKY